VDEAGVNVEKTVIVMASLLGLGEFLSIGPKIVHVISEIDGPTLFYARFSCQHERHTDQRSTIEQENQYLSIDVAIMYQCSGSVCCARIEVSKGMVNHAGLCHEEHRRSGCG